MKKYLLIGIDPKRKYEHIVAMRCDVSPYSLQISAKAPKYKGLETYIIDLKNEKIWDLPSSRLYKKGVKIGENKVL